MKNYKNYLFIMLGFVFAMIVISLPAVGAQVAGGLSTAVNDPKLTISSNVSAAPADSTPLQVGKKYMVFSTQTKTVAYILVDGIKGDWVDFRAIVNGKVPAPSPAGQSMWFNSQYFTMVSEIK
ncbi:MAG TPA: hypothetical protein VGO50_17555 [Pyrinomonadaceae bacterium]|jgi:hypothetical protein|nr:hypothetical protein [Pyrinomonadaceae bacterium]